jgi:hypothetical protein
VGMQFFLVYHRRNTAIEVTRINGVRQNPKERSNSSRN